MTEKELQSYLGKEYQGYKSFCETLLFPIFGKDEAYWTDEYGKEVLTPMNPDLQKLANDTGISSVKRVGKILIGETLEVFDVTVIEKKKMEQNRSGIQAIIRRIMGTFSHAFILFHYDNVENSYWRFSYCHIGESKSKDVTDSKRFTFLLGPGQSCHTAASNFISLINDHNKGENIDGKKVADAFSLQAVSDDFFKQYTNQYTKFVAYITGKAYIEHKGKYIEDPDYFKDNDKELYAAFGYNDKRVRNYVKRLLSRIVFLHFVQKKGWLGVPKDSKRWDGGNHRFMRDLFEKSPDDLKDDFLDKVLEPLFTALDTDRSDNNDLYHIDALNIDVRIPYLNSGLFGRDDDDAIRSRFPADYFQELFKLLSHYNFTIDENDPNDAEIGVDPEMLSRIFESLLEDNKDKGAYYTPKEVVRHMCCESLIAYLQTDSEQDSDDNVRKFVTTYNKDYIPNIKDDVDKKLKEVKICDPAIGSGAFPMGMLNEIFLCRRALEEFTDSEKIKREIIQNNIYGVDIEKGAVEIARLRFWLSLVVDEEKPETLPNLDFKIMEGNSLITTFHGEYIDLDLSHDIDRTSYTKIHNNLRELAKQQGEYYNSKGEDKMYLGIGIKHLILDTVISQLQYEFDSWMQNKQTSNDIFGTYDANTEKQKDKSKSKKSKVKDFPQKRLDILSECKQLDEYLLDDTQSLEERAQTEIPFFDWHIMFNDVFSRKGKEGFDIIIGNPPYISAPTQLNKPELKEQRQNIIDSKQYSTITEKWDLYVPFMELGIHLLVNDGIFAMIVPYPLSNQKYGKKLRKFITENTRIIEIADLNGTKVFENADVFNCIPILRKAKPSERFPIVHANEKLVFKTAFTKSLTELVQDPKTYVWNFRQAQRTSSRFPDMNVLGDYCYISKGMVLNADEKTAKGAFSKSDLISNTKDEIHPRKYLEAKDISKYTVKRVRYLEWNTERCPGKLRRPTFNELYDNPRIILNCLGSLNATIDEDEHFLHNHSIYCAVPWKYLHGVKNRSISNSIKRYSHKSRNDMERLSKGINLYYLLAIINSSMANVLLDDQRGGDYHIYPEHIRNLPIAPASEEEQLSIGNLAKKIVAMKTEGKDASPLEDEIDKKVKELYNRNTIK